MVHVPVELSKQLIELFHWVDPGPHSTHLVSDLSGWWREPGVLAAIGPALAALFADERPTVVVAPEATGFLLGPLVATALDAGFVPAVKAADGRVIAGATSWAETGPDYRGRRLRLGVCDRHLGPGDRVLVVDDWVATGAQIRALYQVIANRGAEAVGAAAVVADCPSGIADDLRLRSLLTSGDLDLGGNLHQ